MIERDYNQGGNEMGKWQVRVQEPNKPSWVLEKNLDKKSAEKMVTQFKLGARMKGKLTSYKAEVMTWRNS